MEKFMTQFVMGGVKADATVHVLGTKKFGIFIHLFDAFEGGEITPADQEMDGIITQNEDGYWSFSEPGKIHLSDEDLQNLGAAIEMDYLMR
jgi:hypothetical protein